MTSKITAQIYKIDDDEYEVHSICNNEVIAAIGWGAEYSVKRFCGGYKIILTTKGSMTFHCNVDDYVCLTWME